MDGMTMMLKSFGINPDDLKRQFTEIVDNLSSELKTMKESQLRTEKIATETRDMLRTSLQPTGGSMDSMNGVTSEHESEQHAERLTDGGSFDSTS